jgi:two-component system sensor histidine kinase VicK
LKKHRFFGQLSQDMEIADIDVLKRMTDKSEDIYFIFDVSNGQFQYVNDAFEKLTLRKGAELLEDPELLFQMIHEEDLDYVKLKIKELSKTEDCRHLSFRIFRPNQTIRWVKLKVYSILEEGKLAYLAGNAVDDSLRKVNSLKLQAINSWKNSALNHFSHDFTGPFGTIKMFAEVIAKKSVQSQEIQKFADIIVQISQRTIILIQGLVRKETIETVSTPIQNERIDLVEAIGDTIAVFKLQNQTEKKITFTYSHNRLYAEVDTLKFLRILHVLISNAFKLTGKDGQIMIHIENLDSTLLLTVNDNGSGLPIRVQRDFIMNSEKNLPDGHENMDPNDLGLLTLKSLVRDHKGELWFETSTGKGTTIYVELPLIH